MNSQGLVTTSGNGTTRYTGGVMNIHESSAVPAVDERRRRDGPSVGLPVRISKWFLLLAAWGVFVWWISLWFRMPSEEGKAFKKEVSLAVNASTFWGKYATNYVMYVVPVIGLALIALLYLELEERFPERPKCPASGKQPFVVNLWRAIWTQPLLVKTPVGVITLIDIVIFVIITVCSLWIWFELLSDQFYTIDHAKPKKGAPSKTAQKWDKTAAMLGRALPFTVGCLFIPVARGSPLLRFIDVPFDQAIKYHRWIGYVTAVLVAVHGGTYAVSIGIEQKLHLLIQWKYNGISNLAGLIAGVAAVIMAITSIPYVRARHFNFFFTMHHLYLAFFMFYVFHVDWNHSGASMGPILLFFVDRFLRMVQSWKQITGVSARVLPSGLVELKIPKQSGLKYNALSFVYLNVPGTSRLQWHPFSTTSSTLDDASALTVCIKPLGDWTQNLHDNIAAQSAKASGCPFAVKTVHAEGPYGHESNYFLRYKNLVLVAGGAGVTPFLAVIQDLLKRHQLLQSRVPTSVHLIWCVRRRTELATLKTIKPSHIYPGYSYDDTSKAGSFHLNIQAYVTGEPAMTGDHKLPDAETWNLVETSSRNFQFRDSPQKDGKIRDHGMSTVNSFQNVWMMALIVASMTGFVLMHALLYNYVSSPKFLKKGEKFPTAEEGVLHLVSLFVGIVICGGSVIFFWIARAGKLAGGPAATGNGLQEPVKIVHLRDLEGNNESDLLDSCVVTEGARPQFEEVFDEVAGKHEGEEVGVLVCGPGSLQESVAAACRARNFESLMKTPFHYHSVSFDL